MESDCTSLSSEEFSRVQEESVDKISEISNQPDSMGKTVSCVCTELHHYLTLSIMLLLCPPLQNQWMQKESRLTHRIR